MTESGPTRGFYEQVWDRFGSAFVLEEKVRHLRSLTDRYGVRLAGSRILDCGSGAGATSAAFAQLGAREVVGLDQTDQAARAGEALCRGLGLGTVSFRKADLLVSPLPADREFDVVYSFGVLHHTGDARRALHNIAGHARPGGFLIVGLYLKTWLTPFWQGICSAYRWSRAIAFVVSHAAYVVLRVSDRFFGKQVMRDFDLRQQIHDWFAVPVRSHHTIREAQSWLSEEGFDTIGVVEKLGRIRSATNFCVIGRKRS